MARTRIERLRAELSKQGLSSFLVSQPAHVRYLTGFTGSNSLVLIRDRSEVLYTDSRYRMQARRESKLVPCRITNNELVVEAGGDISGMKSPRIGYEAAHLSVREFQLLRKSAPKARFIGTSGTMESIVSRKDSSEIRFIARAVKISDRVFETILPKIRPGVRERDIAAEISFLHRQFGGEGDAFEPIVASGRRSALPHAGATGRVIRRGDVVLLDFGCTVHGYHSDMTRTVAVGPVSSRIRTMHAGVLEAGEIAISTVRAGIPVRKLDWLVRRHLQKSGLARFFIHSLGHGIGLQVHERPRISARSNEVLVAGNVITIEPGVYIPSVGGVRIEDDILVKPNGCEVLGTSPRELLVV